MYRGGELAKQGRKGRHSPGPAYSGKDDAHVHHERAPRAVIGTAKRNNIVSASYAYYERPDCDVRFKTFHPSIVRTAGGRQSSSREATTSTDGFGAAGTLPLRNLFLQFNRSRSGIAPGPHYDVNVAALRPRAPRYTMQPRRMNGGVAQLGSTSVVVGPGSYESPA